MKFSYLIIASFWLINIGDKYERKHYSLETTEFKVSNFVGRDFGQFCCSFRCLPILILYYDREFIVQKNAKDNAFYSSYNALRIMKVFYHLQKLLWSKSICNDLIWDKVYNFIKRMNDIISYFLQTWMSIILAISTISYLILKIWDVIKTFYNSILKAIDSIKMNSLPNFAMLYILFTNVNEPLRIPTQWAICTV
jgi:hypothetical protein